MAGNFFIDEIASARLPDERRFGILFAVIFAAAGGYAFFQGANVNLTIVLSCTAVVLAAVSLLSPGLLAPFNRAWFVFGLLLGKVVGPVVLGAIFFLLITPVAIVARLAGRDELRLRERNVDSYWIDRNPVGPDSGSFKNQF